MHVLTAICIVVCVIIFWEHAIQLSSEGQAQNTWTRCRFNGASTNDSWIRWTFSSDERGYPPPPSGSCISNLFRRTFYTIHKFVGALVVVCWNVGKIVVGEIVLNMSNWFTLSKLLRIVVQNDFSCGVVIFFTNNNDIKLNKSHTFFYKATYQLFIIKTSDFSLLKDL